MDELIPTSSAFRHPDMFDKFKSSVDYCGFLVYRHNISGPCHKPDIKGNNLKSSSTQHSTLKITRVSCIVYATISIPLFIQTCLYATSWRYCCTMLLQGQNSKERLRCSQNLHRGTCNTCRSYFSWKKFLFNYF